MGLVKTVRFKNPKYVGDPINAVKIFNEKEIDEIIILDITTTSEKRPPDIKMINEIAGEAFMPLGYWGGITNIDEMKKIFHCGVEKVVINSAAAENPRFIGEAAKLFGSQSIVVSIDVKNNILGKYSVYTHSGEKKIIINPIEFAKTVEGLSVGEIFLNSIDRDGTYLGYDFDLIGAVCQSVSIPVIVCGGARNTDDFQLAMQQGASAVAAGSIFIFQGRHRAVLINFPSEDELLKKLSL